MVGDSTMTQNKTAQNAKQAMLMEYTDRNRRAWWRMVGRSVGDGKQRMVGRPSDETLDVVNVVALWRLCSFHSQMSCVKNLHY